MRKPVFFILVAAIATTTFLQAQDLEVRAYPAKENFLAGEPVFFEFEVINVGTEPVRIGTGGSYGGCAPPSGLRFEVVGQTRPKTNHLHCYMGIAGSCMSGIMTLRPGASYHMRFLLNRFYPLEEPGTYRVLVRRHVTLYPAVGTSSQYPAGPESQFSITVRPANPQELQVVYEPYVKILENRQSPDFMDAFFALAILAPSFAEEALINLSHGESPFGMEAVIGALGKLNTEAARQRLAEVVRAGTGQGVQYQAILALAKTGDRTYLPVLQEAAAGSDSYLGAAAIRAFGYLGGEESIPFLVTLLRKPDVSVRESAVTGLANTKTLKAIPILIEMLNNPEGRVRRSANWALSQLTHRSVPFDTNAAGNQAARRWQSWWFGEREEIELYGPGQCAQPLPLG